MDLKNLSGAASSFGGKMLETGDQDTGAMFGSLFSGNNDQTSKEEFAKMQECAQMIEKYVDRVPKNAGMMPFDTHDMVLWRNDFFKTLVHGGPKLPDDSFYTGVTLKKCHQNRGVLKNAYSLKLKSIKIAALNEIFSIFGACFRLVFAIQLSD